MNIAELQRDAANKELKDFKDKCDITHNSSKELRNLPITKLKQLKVNFAWTLNILNHRQTEETNFLKVMRCH